MSTLGNFMSSGVYRGATAINEAMGRVYAYMGLATLVSMLVSAYVGLNPELVKFFFTGAMHWIVMLAPLAFIFLVPVVLNSNPPRSVALAMLCAFSGLMGLSMAVVFAVYTMASIVSAFMGAAVLFGVMSFYGYFTKQSLDSVGKYAFIALIAIIIVSIINIFIGSSVLQMIVSAIAILVFLALTAYDTQQIREMVSVDDGDSTAVEVMGALTLYLDFINLFINLLQLFGVVKGSDD
jgi:FtsH-binding integral membrane protein